MSWASIPWGTIFAALDLLLLVGLGLLVRWSPRVSAGLTKIVREELAKQLAPLRRDVAELRARMAVPVAVSSEYDRTPVIDLGAEREGRGRN